jgi:hypothetical protein
MRGSANIASAAFLDEPARVHHRDAIGHAGDDAEIVGDDDHRHAELALQRADQLEDLRLDGHVERVVGSSAISSFGLQASAIAIITRWRMPPENWCGKCVEPALGRGMPTMPSSSMRARRERASSRVELEHLGDLAADRQHRVERRHRVLEDHRDVAAAHAPHLLGRQRRAVAALEAIVAARRCARRRHSRMMASEVTDLPRARLADDAERLAALDRERDAVDRVHASLRRCEMHRETRRSEQRAHAGTRSRRRPVAATARAIALADRTPARIRCRRRRAMSSGVPRVPAAHRDDRRLARSPPRRPQARRDSRATISRRSRRRRSDVVDRVAQPFRRSERSDRGGDVARPTSSRARLPAARREAARHARRAATGARRR